MSMPPGPPIKFGGVGDARDWRPPRADDSIPLTDQLANRHQSDVRGQGAQLLLQHGGAAFGQEQAR
jgi:hypothetical protein